MTTATSTTSARSPSFLERNQLPIFFTFVLVISATIAAIAFSMGDENIASLSVFGPSLVAIALTGLILGRVRLRMARIRASF